MPITRPIPERPSRARRDADLQALLAVPADRRGLYLRNSGRGYALVEALIRHCFSLRFDSLEEMLETGCLATESAASLRPGQTGRGEKELLDLRAHATAVFGNALRIAGHATAADQALALSERHLAAGTGERRDLVALRLELTASLRARQQEFDEARDLLARALELRQALGDRNGTAKIRIQQGLLHGYADDPERAALELAEAVDLVEDDRDLARSAYQSLIWHLIDACRLERARSLLAKLQSLLSGGGDLFQLKLRWLEARLAAVSGDSLEIPEAREGFRSTHLAYEQRGMTREARLVALDLEELEAGREGKFWLWYFRV